MKPKARRMWAVVNEKGEICAAREGYRHQAILAFLNALPSDTSREECNRRFKFWHKRGHRVVNTVITWVKK